MVPPAKGILAALWTPLDARGRVLRPALAAHLAFLRQRGVKGVLALGSTGEFPRFDLRQRSAVLEAVAEAAGPLPVVANVSAIRLDEVIALGQLARSLRLPGVALMAPYFYPLSQADLLEFFLRAAEGIGLPVCLYNFPELAGNRIALETVSAFADRAPLFALKQSGGEFAYHRPLIALGREKHFSVFSGADTRLPEVFALGAAGCIGGLANFVPELMVSIFQAAAKKRAGTAAAAAEQMKTVGRLVDQISFPLNIAAGLEARGLRPGAPKTVVSPTTAALYRKVAAELGALFDSLALSRSG
jgi:4-hydroxy-tetrahydrodipicolinate synthase